MSPRPRKTALTSGGFCGTGPHRPRRRHPHHRPATAFFDPLRANPRDGSRTDVAVHLFVRGRHAVQAPCHTRAVGRRMAGKYSPQHGTIYRHFRRLERHSGCSTPPPHQAYSALRMLVRSARPALPHFWSCLNRQSVSRRLWFRKPASAPFRSSLPFCLDRQRVLRRLWFRPSPPCCR